MCSRYSVTSPPEAVRSYFGYAKDHVFPPRYNIAPTQPVPIVRTGADNAREFALVRWGLLPSWVKDPKAFTTLINARAETITEKPSFRSAIRYRRCLFPCNGFYEWTGQKGARRVYLIRPRKNGLLAFAGIWEHWMGPEGSEMESAAIITTAANRIVGAVHGRMPAILSPDHFASWLDCRDGRAGDAASMLAPAPEDLLEVVEIGTRVNNPRFDDPSVQEPLAERLM